MKRRLLLVSADKGERTLITGPLQARFRSLDIVIASTFSEAQRIFVEHGCDIIVSSLHLTDCETTSHAAHSLLSMARTIPVIALTKLLKEDDNVLDILAMGVRHILYCEDLKSTPTTLVNTVIEVLHDVNTQAAQMADFAARMNVMSTKLWDVDNRMEKTEMMLAQLSSGIEKLVGSIDKRGGLEDRVVKLEQIHATAIRFGIAFAGICATLITGLLTHLFEVAK